MPGVRLLGYCLMPDHWHLLLVPAKTGELSDFVRWISTMHVRRQRQRAGSGDGEVYQSRFRNFPVQQDDHLLTLRRFIESNPRRERLVSKAEQWRWSSLGGAASPDGRKIISPSLVRLPKSWNHLVDDLLEESVAAEVRETIRRGRPFGDSAWVAKTAARLGLEYTIRPQGRPRKPLVPGKKSAARKQPA